MNTSFDIDGIVRKLLVQAGIETKISGRICYQNDRPDNSDKEDIAINTIAMTQDYLPQIATSNVNVYVPDMTVRIDGKEQKKPNHKRLAELSRLVLGVLRSANIEGMKLIPENQSVLAETNVSQHFCNIRISWNIQTGK